MSPSAAECVNDKCYLHESFSLRNVPVRYFCVLHHISCCDLFLKCGIDIYIKQNKHILLIIIQVIYIIFIYPDCFDISTLSSIPAAHNKY